MREIEAKFQTTHKYQINENDPVFEEINDDQLIKLVRSMLFIDVFQSTKEEDILPLIEVTIHD